MTATIVFEDFSTMTIHVEKMDVRADNYGPMRVELEGTMLSRDRRDADTVEGQVLDGKEKRLKP